MAQGGRGHLLRRRRADKFVDGDQRRAAPEQDVDLDVPEPVTPDRTSRQLVRSRARRAALSSLNSMRKLQASGAVSTVSGSKYVQLAEVIRARILDGTYPVGSRLPAEVDFMEETGYSRDTVRGAVKLLKDATYDKRLARFLDRGRFVGSWDPNVPRSRNDSPYRHASRLGGDLSADPGRRLGFQADPASCRDVIKRENGRRQ